MLPNSTKFCIKGALYSSKSRRNLLSFKDIRGNGYHIETNNEGSQEYLYITSMVLGQKLILGKEKKNVYFLFWVILYHHEIN